MGFFETTKIVRWADCDSAGIVFYPNYFSWMDGAFHELTLAAGFDQRRLQQDYDVFGTPLVDASATFHSPASYGDRLDVTAVIEKIGNSSLVLVYSFNHKGRLVLEGREARVFVARSDSGISKVSIPQNLRTALEVWIDN